MLEYITEELKSSANTISKIDPAQIRAAADLIKETFKNGGQAIFMGNGGSSADAQHIAAEFSGKYLFDRPALPSICLSNIAPVTAIGNDYCYDIVFKRQIEANCRKGDVVIGMSTSGNSKNVVLAIEKAKEIGAKAISFTGDGGKLKDMVDVAVVIPSKETPRIQEGYLCACHTICGIVEREMFGQRAVFIDRDGTLGADVPHCHVPEQFVVYDGVPEAIKRLNDAGFLVIMITNQSGIGRGMYGEPEFRAVNDKIFGVLAEKGAHFDDVFFCPHLPDAGCDCRKPKIGMGRQAMAKYCIDTSRSFMLGDNDKDMEFGKGIGALTFRVSSGEEFVSAVDAILDE